VSFNLSTGDAFEIHINYLGEEQVHRTLIDHVVSESQFAIYTPLYQGKVLLVSERQRMDVVFSQLDPITNRYEIYKFKASLVTRITRDNVSMWIIERLGDYSKVQRRDYYRLNLVKPMMMTLNQHDDLKVEVLSRDISAGGMRCVTNKKLRPLEHVTCHLNMNPSKPLAIQGEVVSSELMPDSRIKFDTRIRFIAMPKVLQTTLMQQINVLQAEYLKKSANSNVEEKLDSVMASIDLKKLDQVNRDGHFEVKLGYLGGLQWLAAIIVVVLYIAARPMSEYPMERWNNIFFSRGWSAQLLYANIGMSCILIFLGVVGVIVERNYYAGRKPIKLSFLLGIVLGIISILVLVTLFSTVVT